MVQKRGRELLAAASRRRWSEDDASDVLESLDRSGLSEREFADEHGLDVQRLHYWQKRRAMAILPTAPAFVELVRDRPAVQGRPALELVMSTGEVIRVGAEFDDVTLRRLLAVVRSC